jgi:butyryl-CoA dehydrogenase
VVTAAIVRGSQGWVCAEPVFATSGPGAGIIELGEDALREKYLPGVVTGTKGCGISLSEAMHGSDLSHLETTARIEGDEVVIDGAKKWTTGADVNELFIVFCRFDEIPGARGIGAVVVERGFDGVTIQRGPNFLGLRGLTHGYISYDEVRVPKENLIAGAGGFRRLMTAFNMERIHNAAIALGLMQAAYDETAAYVQKREAFGRLIVEFQDVHHRLVDVHTTIQAHRLLLFHAAASGADGRAPDALATATAKLFGSTSLPQVTLKCMELHGGIGVTKDSPLERMHRDAVSTVPAGGAPAILRNSIASMLFPEHRFTQTRDFSPTMQPA